MHPAEFVLGCRSPNAAKVLAAKRRSFLGSCRDALPGLAGSIIAIAAMALVGRGVAVPLEPAASSPVPDMQAQEEVRLRWDC